MRPHFKSHVHSAFVITKPDLEQDQQRQFDISKAFQDGIKRIQNVTDSEEFSFIVNGIRFLSTIFESVLLSPAVENLLLNDCETQEFIISDEDIEVADFSLVFEFLSFDGASQSLRSFSSQKSLLSIFRHLQNHQLELIRLIRPEILTKSKPRQIVIDQIASELHQQSKVDILSLSTEILDSIL
jgi:hypothetical protein